MNKQLSEFSDEEEIVFCDRLAAAFKELDDLLTLNTLEYDSEKQQAMTIEITGSDHLKVKKNVILNQKQKEEAEELGKKIEKLLKDVSPNVYDAVLVGLLNKNFYVKD